VNRRVLVAVGLLTGQGGQDRLSVDVAEGMARAGDTVDVFYRRPGQLLERVQAAARSTRAVGDYMVDPSHPARGARRFLAAVVAGRRRRPDAVYVVQLFDSPFGAGVVFGRARSRALVCHLQIPPPRRYGVQWTWAMPNVDRFVAVSEFIRSAHVATGLAAECIDVVPNGVDTSRFTPGHDVAADGFTVLFAGRLDRGKGVEVLLSAWAQMAHRPGDRLVVCGGPLYHPGGPAAAAAFAGELRASASADPTVEWVGHVDDVLPFYRRADVVVMPSTWTEPAGLVALEAMACGRPVVATAVGGLPEYLPPSLPPVPAHDAGALAAAIEGLRDWRVQRPALGDEVRAHVIAHFDLARTVAGMRRVIDDAVSSRRSVRQKVAMAKALWKHDR
jgi:glycosyltransferase involved in cell wall biosynthesis